MNRKRLHWAATCLAAATTGALSVRGAEVGGIISTAAIWRASASPIVVTQDVTVTASGSLTIEAGVQVQMYEATQISASGPFAALGTAANPILFTNHPSFAYGGQVRLEGTDFSAMATGALQHCIFRNSNPLIPAVYGAFCSVQMADCDVRTDGEGIQFWDSRVTIVRNFIEVYTPLDPVDMTRSAGLFGTNYVSFPNGDLNAVDVNFTYDGPGDVWMILENNTVRGGLGSNSDCMDLGSARAIVRGNHLFRCGDKGVSLGEQTIAYIYDNFIEQCGMGLGVKDSSQAICANNTIVNCTYGVKSYQKNAGKGGGKTSMTNCIVWACGQSVLLLDGSTLDARNCDIQLDGAAVWPGAGNIDQDPQFVDPAAQNYRLLPGSPCVDSGINQPWMDAGTDLDGAARIAGGVVDIGCYELTLGALSCNFTADPPSGPPPLGVVFTAHVTGTNTFPVYYQWDFGSDGVIDLEGWGLDVAINVYPTAGRYAVSLAVVNADGERAQIEKPDAVRVTGPPFVYVAPDGEPRYPYTNWASAARDLQTAVDAGIEGTTVLVTNGVYDLSATVTVREYVVVSSVNGPGRTTVNGGGLVRCFTLAHPDAVVDGFTITGGRADRGGGVYLDGNGIVRNCILRNNSATADGGGALLAQGGLLRNCLIVGNASDARGGGVAIEKLGHIDNCTISGNAAVSGGGIRTFDGGTILNSIVYYNQAGGNVVNAGSLYYFAYAYSCMTPLIAGAGNKASAPLFADRAGGNYRLLPGSPCIDAGQNEVWMGAEHDLDGVPRLLNDIVDMGAYESGMLACDFAGAPRSGTLPLTVVFTAAVSGLNTQGLAYAWDLDGDGTTDAAGAGRRSVTYTYTNAGTYTVALVVSNAAGYQASAAKPDYIVANVSVLHVSRAGRHIAPYSSWDLAATNIETAVAYATPGNTILVTNGIYEPPAPIVIAKEIALRGFGWPQGAIIDGGGAHRCLQVQNAGAVVENFTLCNGKADNGGGVFLAGGTIQNCAIFDNAADINGGGVYVSLDGLVQDCRILNNSAAAAYDTRAGGGGACLSQGGTIRRCLVAGNVAIANDGGGLFLYRGGLAQSCLVASNTAADSTGGAYLYVGGDLESCTVVDNVGLRYSGTRGNDGGVFRNCIIWNNRTPGGTVVNYGDGGPPNPVYTFCDTTPLHSGASNIVADPLFVNPAAGDYRLQSNSPCLDAGTLESMPAADCEGVPRPLDGNGDGTALPDIGAYEALRAAADSDRDRMPDGWELAYGLNPVQDDAGGDLDADGFVNRAEYAAGTRPDDPLDLLRFDTCAAGPPAGGIRLQWASKTGKYYTVYSAASLAAPQTNVYATPGNGFSLAYTNREAGSPRRFFRLGVR